MEKNLEFLWLVNKLGRVKAFLMGSRWEYEL